MRTNSPLMRSSPMASLSPFDEHETRQVATVRVERDRLEAVDATVSLQLPQVVHRTGEDLPSRLLAARDERAPTHEQRCFAISMSSWSVQWPTVAAIGSRPARRGHQGRGGRVHGA